MIFDIIITSYNRPQKVEWLVQALHSEYVRKIIIVDSGGNTFHSFESNDKVILCRSSHKNQPYQRYLGHQIAETDWLLYLDDDMEPIDGWDTEICMLIEKYSSVGIIGIKFEDKHQETFLKRNERSITSRNTASPFVQRLRYLTGYPILPAGRFYKNGVRAGYPSLEGPTDYVGGPVFLANRKILYQNFNMELFSLFEKRMGTGEDSILSYTAAMVASGIFYPKQLFWHNDQGNSVYTQNHYQFNKIVAFSRLYLNLEYYRLNNLSLLFAKFSFINYSFWRILGFIINLIFKPSKNRFTSLRGYFVGTMKALFYHYEENLLKNYSYWNSEAVRDLNILKGGGKYV
ncbi:glycosyltransferase family A protein [Sphingobacterium siyangense]|uniref:glycosyltransferase family 2 protein n=1 Tax=Sphingobacterium siyangense TaxID=459529 RepID=UPI002FDEDD36